MEIRVWIDQTFRWRRRSFDDQCFKTILNHQFIYSFFSFGSWGGGTEGGGGKLKRILHGNEDGGRGSGMVGGADV